MKDKLLPLILSLVMVIDPEVAVENSTTPLIDNFSSVEEEADKYHGLLADFSLFVSQKRKKTTA